MKVAVYIEQQLMFTPAELFRLIPEPGQDGRNIDDFLIFLDFITRLECVLTTSPSRTGWLHEATGLARVS